MSKDYRITESTTNSHEISCCFRKQKLKNRGNGLIATRKILAGEIIIDERPFLWNRFEKNNSFCSNCASFIKAEPINCLTIGCQINYCSTVCRFEANKKGHLWMCISNTNGGIIDRLQEHDPKGEIILALMLYCIIAQNCLEKSIESQIALTCNEILEVGNLLLSKEDFQMIDYCRTEHAARSGISAVTLASEDLFLTLIAPAFYDSYLAGPMEIFKEVFTTSPIWDNVKNTFSCNLAKNFLDSGIFEPLYFRNIMGIFVTNNLQIMSTHTGENNIELVLNGTGIYSTYSKMNHACICNTTNGGGFEQAKVIVSALKDIEIGEEITTSYLHCLNPNEISRKKRCTALSQYLFVCECILCEEQKLNENSDDDSDGY